MGQPEEEDEGPLVRRVVTEAGSSCKAFATDFCSVAHLKKRLPIIEWLPKYNLAKLVADAIAGLTVGLTVIPQGLAYAALAGLELQVGNHVLAYVTSLQVLAHVFKMHDFANYFRKMI